MVQDTYVILRRGPSGQYSPIGKSIGKEAADRYVALLKQRTSGEYLLLNLRTKVIEESNDTSSKLSNRRFRARA